MTPQPDALLDRIFFGICFLVTAFVALRPVAFFRAITLDTFDHSRAHPRLLRVVQMSAVTVSDGAVFTIGDGQVA